MAALWVTYRLPQWLFLYQTLSPQPSTQCNRPMPLPLSGCGLILVATDEGHMVWDLRKRKQYCGSVGLKMCVTNLAASPCFTSHLPPTNSDANALGHRYTICTPLGTAAHTNTPRPPAIDTTSPATPTRHVTSDVNARRTA